MLNGLYYTFSPNNAYIRVIQKDGVLSKDQKKFSGDVFAHICSIDAKVQNIVPMYARASYFVEDGHMFKSFPYGLRLLLRNKSTDPNTGLFIDPGFKTLYAVFRDLITGEVLITLLGFPGKGQWITRDYSEQNVCHYLDDTNISLTKIPDTHLVQLRTTG